MVRVLIIIAVTGFLLSLASLTAAAAIGGRELANAGWSWRPWWVEFDDGHGGVHMRSNQGPRATREIAWDGSERLAIDLPAEVRFVQADGAGKLTLSGPPALINAVRLENGRLSMPKGIHSRWGTMEITLTAPKVTAFQINGADELTIENYRQDKLAIEVNGHAEVEAAGEAKTVELSVSGAGDAELADLAVDEAIVRISGAGEATIAPRTRAQVDISGVAEVTLATEPEQLETNISGAGKVIHARPSVTEPDRLAPPKPVA